MKKYLADTNALLSQPSILESYPVVITSHVLREIEQLERKKSDKALQFEIRRLKRYLDSVDHSYFDLRDYKFTLSDDLDGEYVDNILLQIAVRNDLGIITFDKLLKEKCRLFGVEVIEPEKNDNDDYTGIKELLLDLRKDEDNILLSKLYSQDFDNELNLVENQYVIIWDKNKPTYDENGKIKGYECIDALRFDGEKLTKLKYNNIKNNFTGTVKPLNVKQRLAFDLLQNKDITVKSLFGVFGSGKDYIMISHAVHMIEKGRFDKIVWVRNNVEVKDTNPIGFLPDDLESKLKPWLAPLQDHLGGEYGLQEFINKGFVEVQHLGFIRGRDIKNSIIYVTECQSNTKNHIQLLLGRVGEGSQIWFNGDLKQVDDDKFLVDNGVNALKKLKGQPLYGQVVLDKTERSETARLADLLD